MTFDPETYRHPIPRENRSSIAKLFELVLTRPDFYGLEDVLLSPLKPTELSLIAHYVGVEYESICSKKYLNPLRDVEVSMTLFNRLMDEGHTLLILGDDVEMMMERIKNPGSYWYKRALEANMATPSVRVPAVWIVSLPPTMNDKAGYLEAVKVRYARPISDRAFLEIFDNEVLVQPKRILEDMYRKASSLPPTDLKDGLKQWRMRSAMELKLVELEAHRNTGSQETRCRAGLVTVSIDWKKVYLDWEYAPKLSYVNASKDPLKIESSVGHPVKSIDEYKRAVVLHQKLKFQREDELWVEDKSPFKLLFTIPHDLPTVGAPKKKKGGRLFELSLTWHHA